MKLYGYIQFSIIKPKCYCCCCEASERHAKQFRKRNRKRARRLAKIEIKRQLDE